MRCAAQAITRKIRKRRKGREKEREKRREIRCGWAALGRAVRVRGSPSGPSGSGRGMCCLRECLSREAVREGVGVCFLVVVERGRDER